jgi:hypothetical protein
MHIEAWHDFFVAEVGASAALAGLLVVAISINIARILENAALPLRAGHSLTIVTSSFVIASLGLMPVGEAFVLKAMAVAAIVGWLASSLLVSIYTRTVALETAGDSAADQRKRFIYDRVFIVSTQIATVSQLVGGIRILTGHDGLLAIALGMLAAFLVAIYTTWVLLVEILR